MAKTQIGTPSYMAPEIWQNRPYSFSSDTWAVGCLLYEMCTGKVRGAHGLLGRSRTEGCWHKAAQPQGSTATRQHSHKAAQPHMHGGCASIACALGVPYSSWWRR